MATDDIPPKVRAHLRLGENPYALVDFQDDESTVGATNSSQVPGVVSKRKGHRRSAVADENQGDLFRAVSQIDHSAEEGSGNPYASLAALPDEGEEIQSGPLKVDPADSLDTVSKAEFRRLATRIFRQYIPALVRGRLRTYMIDFIERNETKPPRIRYLLLKAFERFDLSDLSGAIPYFNREEQSLSEEKLREIERSVSEDK